MCLWFRIMGDSDGLLEVLYNSTLSYRVSLDFLPLSILKVRCSPHLCTSLLFHPGTRHITCQVTLLATLKVTDGMLQPEYLHTWLIPVFLKCCCQDKRSPAVSNAERRGFELLSAICLICAFNRKALAFFDLQTFFPWKLLIACNNLGGPLSDC